MDLTPPKELTGGGGGRGGENLDAAVSPGGGTTSISGGAIEGGAGGVATGGTGAVTTGGTGGDAGGVATGGTGAVATGGTGAVATGDTGGVTTGGRGGVTTGGAAGVSAGGRGGTATGGTTGTGGSTSPGDAAVPDVRPPSDLAPPVDVTRPPDTPVDTPATPDAAVPDVARVPDVALIPDVPQVPDLPPDGPAPIPGLLLYYSCDQVNGTTLPDMSGNGRDGTLTGPFSVGAGKVGSALSLTANNTDSGAPTSGGYVVMPQAILAGATTMTIAAWFKINSNLQYQRIFDIGGVGGTGAATASMYLTPNGNTGHLQFTIRTAQPDGGTFAREDITDGTPSGTPTTMSTGVWWHVAVVLDASGGRLYLNGNQVGSTTPMTMRPSTLGNTPNDWIGRSQFAVNPYLDGAIDEFRVYNRGLTATEISALYTFAGH